MRSHVQHGYEWTLSVMEKIEEEGMNSLVQIDMGRWSLAHERGDSFKGGWHRVRYSTPSGISKYLERQHSKNIGDFRVPEVLNPSCSQPHTQLRGVGNAEHLQHFILRGAEGSRALAVLTPK